MLPDRAAYRARWTVLHGGVQADDSRATAAWLSTVEMAARPLARSGVVPDALTALGVGVAAAAPLAARRGGRWNLAAGAGVAASGFADGLDGAVAVLSGTDTPWGFVLDSLADRGSDALQLLALRAAGAAGPLPLTAAAGTALLEYARARVGAAGFAGIGRVTVGERPVRVAVAATSLLLAGALPRHAQAVATVGAGAIAALSLTGAYQFLRTCAPLLREREGWPASSGGSDQAGNGGG